MINAERINSDETINITEHDTYKEIWSKTPFTTLLYNGYDEISETKHVKQIIYDNNEIDVIQTADCINGTGHTTYNTHNVEKLEIGTDFVAIRIKPTRSDLSYQEWCDIASTNCWELR